MATTTFSGPVVSTNGFTGAVTGDVTGNVDGYISLPTGTVASLPSANSVPVGTIRCVTDNGAGVGGFSLVVSSGLGGWLALPTSNLS